MPRLVTFLATLGATDLATLLAAHPDIANGPAVVDLDDLADRLQHPDHVLGQLVGLDSPTLSLVETVAGLGDAATLDRVAELLGTTSDDAALRQALGHATTSALVFPVPGEATIGANPGVREVVVAPLGLGSTVREVLDHVPARELSKVVRRYGGDVPTRKADLVEAVAAHLADPATVRRALADAPADVFATLEHVVVQQHERALDLGVAGRLVADPWEAGELAEALEGVPFGAHYRAAQWAVDAGLAFRTTLASAELPTEVRYALLRPDVRVPFPAVEPRIATTAVDVGRSQSAASAELTATMASVTAVLEAVGRLKVKLLKSGGVGVREVARLAKAVGVSAAEARLALGLGLAAHLLDGDGELLVPSDGLADWRRNDPALRAHLLLIGWLGAPAVLSRERGPDGKVLPVGGWWDAGAVGLRAAVVRRVRDLPGEAVGIVDVAAVRANLGWWHPLVGVSDDAVRATWDESERLGVVALGRVTDLGRALFRDGRPDEGDPGEPPATILARMLPASTSSVVIGSDLTVVVAGTPSAAVSDLLDVVARRESHGAASTWRLSPESVRDALDAGYTGPMLVERLGELAGGSLPQPVRYLLDDVARRHGRLRVRPAGAVLVCADEALLAEVVAERGARVLELRLVAPTVAVAQAGPEQVLERLRAIGHLPADVDADGVVRLHDSPLVDRDAHQPVDDRLVEQLEVHEVFEKSMESLRDLFGGFEPGASARVEETPDELAARLVEGGLPEEDTEMDDIVDSIGGFAKRLRPAEVRMIALALVDEEPLRIRYRGQSGRVTDRVVSDLQLMDHLLVGWCHLRDGERMFSLDRIERVSLVE